jgi:NAD(P)-dependent dehydrogenase (short-subunit alcohol dehydrogenase family)
MADRQVALITGAGSGIGRAMAMLLAEAGYHVALVARTESKLRETAREIAEECPDAQTLVLPADLTDPAATRALVGKVVDHFGRLDVLGNVAGSAPLQPIEQVTPEIWQACIDSNLSYIVHLTAAAWPIFKQQKSGFVANVSSMASIDPFPGFSIYAAAKVGLNMFTKCTADEGAKLNIRAVAVAPGAVETPMLRANFNEKIIAADKTLDPFEVAGTLVDCILGKRDFKPGETIVQMSP